MKLWEIFRFESRHQARRASTWICAALLLVLTYYMTREIYIDNARNQGYLFNGPFVIATMAFLGSLMGLLIASSVTGDAAARDRLRSRPVDRHSALLARALGDSPP